MITLDILQELVSKIRCKPNWTFSVRECRDEDGSYPLRLIISIPVVDSRGGYLKRIDNYFPVPEATYNRKSWRRWVFECCIKVEFHELGEFFLDGDERPFAPLHGPGEDPYTIHEFRDIVDAHTNQDGSINK